MSAPDHQSPPGMKRMVVRGASIAAGGFLLAQALNLVFYVVLARLIGPAQFGEFAAATVLIGFLLLVTESGMGSAVVQRRDRIEEAASTAVVATIVAGLVFGLLALATSPLVGGFFDSGRIGELAAVASGLVLLRTITAVPDALLQRRFSFLRRVIVEPIQVTVFGVVAVVAAVNDLGAWSLIIGQYAGFTVDVVLSWTLARWRPRLSLVSWSMWRELARYGRHIVAATTVLRVGDQLNILVIGRGLGTQGLGQFSYALRLAATPFQMLLAAAAYVLFPAFARISEHPDRLRPAVLRSLTWMAAASLALGLLFVPLGEAIAVTVFGDVWRPAGDALSAMCLLAFGGMLSSVASEALKAVGRPRGLTPIHLVTTALTIGPMLVLLPLGLTAAAGAISVGAVLGGLYALRVLSQELELPLSDLVGELAAPMVGALALLAATIPLALLLDPANQTDLVGVALIVAVSGTGLAAFAVGMLLSSPDAASQARDGIARLRQRLNREPDAAEYVDEEELPREPTL